MKRAKSCITKLLSPSASALISVGDGNSSGSFISGKLLIQNQKKTAFEVQSSGGQSVLEMV